MSTNFGNLGTDPSVCQGKESKLKIVAAMAATCSTFYEPAMDVLWHTVPDMTPAVRSLPRNEWYAKEQRTEALHDSASLIVVSL